MFETLMNWFGRPSTDRMRCEDYLKSDHGRKNLNSMEDHMKTDVFI
jgi:hypothetical protein